MKTEINLETWKTLYTLAARIHQLAPWGYMDETDLFGVDTPYGLTFVSIMGARGEHLAVAVYPDAVALSMFLRIHEDRNAAPEQVLEIPHFQLSFDSSRQALPEDRSIFKKLGLRFRGKNAWPFFRSFRPVFAAWPIEEADAEILIAVLPELIEVASRFQRDTSLFPEGNDRYLVRSQGRDELRLVPRAALSEVRVRLPEEQIQEWRKLPKLKPGLEVDCFLVPTPIMEGKDRPFYSYLLMAVEDSDGAIVCGDMMSVDSSVELMLGEIPARIVRQFVTAGCRPPCIRVRPGRMEKVFLQVAEQLEISLEVRPRLPKLDPAKRGLLQQMTGLDL